MKKIVFNIAAILITAISFAQTGINTVDPKSTLDVNGSFGTNITEVTDPSLFLLDSTHQTLVFRGTGGTISLPDASTCLGREYTLVNFSTGNIIAGTTLFDAGTGTINAVPTMTVFKIKSNGTNWIQVDKTTTAITTGTALVNTPDVDLKPELKFFYMPSISIDVSTPLIGGSKNLFFEYQLQFQNPMASNPGSAGSIPFFANPNELDYYITFYDNTVLDNVSITNNGLLLYDVVNPANECSFINVVFVVK